MDLRASLWWSEEHIPYCVSFHPVNIIVIFHSGMNQRGKSISAYQASEVLKMQEWGKLVTQHFEREAIVSHPILFPIRECLKKEELSYFFFCTFKGGDSSIYTYLLPYSFYKISLCIGVWCWETQKEYFQASLKTVLFATLFLCLNMYFWIYQLTSFFSDVETKIGNCLLCLFTLFFKS